MSLDPDWYFDHVLYESGPERAARLGPEARWRAWWRDQARRLPGDIAELAVSQGFAMTTAQLRAAGVARHDDRRRVLAGEWSAPQRGVRTVIDPATSDSQPDRFALARRRHVLDCAAAALMNPGHVVCGRSAAVMHGLPTPNLPSRVHLVVEPEVVTRRRGAGQARLASDDMSQWWGVLVTAPARTVVDIARASREAGLMAADAALRAGLVDRSELIDAVRTASRRPGVGQARELVAFADPGAESALESLARLRLHDAGFPPPQLQAEIYVPGRSRPYRVDMLWPDSALAVELDGWSKYDHEELWREKRREDAIRALGLRVVRLSWSDIVREWTATRARLAQLLGL